MESVIVSVIIPVFNIKKYLDECISSVYQQKYSNWEIILVDDGSTDGSEIICDKWRNLDKRITVIHKSNGGLSSARNVGLTIAKGIYIFFLDGDDYIVNNAFTDLFFDLSNKLPDCILFNGKTINESTKIIHTSYELKFKIKKIVTGKEVLNILFYNKVFRPSACLYIFKKSVIDEENLNFCENIIYEDEIFTYILLLNCKSVKKMDNIFYIRRYRDGSIMTNSFSYKNFYSIVTVFRETLNYINKKFLNKKLYIISYRIYQLLYMVILIYSQLSRKDKQKCKYLYIQVLKEFKKEYKNVYILVFICSKCKVKIALLKKITKDALAYIGNLNFLQKLLNNY